MNFAVVLALLTGFLAVWTAIVAWDEPKRPPPSLAPSLAPSLPSDAPPHFEFDGERQGASNVVSPWRTIPVEAGVGVAYQRRGAIYVFLMESARGFSAGAALRKACEKIDLGPLASYSVDTPRLNERGHWVAEAQVLVPGWRVEKSAP